MPRPPRPPNSPPPRRPPRPAGRRRPRDHRPAGRHAARHDAARLGDGRRRAVRPDQDPGERRAGRGRGEAELVQGNPDGEIERKGGNVMTIVKADGDELVHADGKTGFIKNIHRFITLLFANIVY